MATRGALYGLGQHEEGVLNLRGHQVYLHQANRKIAIPLLVSSLGYGIFNEYIEYNDFLAIQSTVRICILKQYPSLISILSMVKEWMVLYVSTEGLRERHQASAVGIWLSAVTGAL